MGTSNGNVIPAFANEDHPHAYGDKFAVFINQAIIPGSSPRVWGQELEMIYVCFSVRIIPTRMGTSNYLRGIILKIRDHPHAYGDKQVNGACGTQIGGSSPRVWGQGNRRRKRGRIPGIIPTRMGTSCYNSTLFNGNKDHPHAYGDKF